jgi:anti-anti-sigma regulatory factor
MVKIQRTTDRTVIVLTISGRLDAENVSELCQSLAAEPADAVVVLDLADLILADRDVVRLLREFEARERIVLRNCPAYIRMWMAGENIQ